MKMTLKQKIYVKTLQRLNGNMGDGNTSFIYIDMDKIKITIMIQ